MDEFLVSIAYEIISTGLSLCLGKMARFKLRDLNHRSQEKII